MTERYTRRAVLAASGTAVAGLAGCLGSLGGGSGGNGDGGTGNQPLAAPTMGDSEASVLVEAYEDFSCPHCATFSLEILPTIVEDYVDTGKARFQHNDLPIPVDEWSWPAASAARAVQVEAGDAAFFDYAHTLFENQGSYGHAKFGSWASDHDAPADTVENAARNETYRPTAKADRKEGIDRGVQGTPGVFVDGELLDSASESNIRSAIESAL